MKQPSACTAMTHLRVPNKNGIITLSFIGRGVPSAANLPAGGAQVAPDAGQEPLELPWESDEAVQVFQLFAQCPSRDALQQATLPKGCLVAVDIIADLLPKGEAAISAAQPPMPPHWHWRKRVFRPAAGVRITAAWPSACHPPRPPPPPTWVPRLRLP